MEEKDRTFTLNEANQLIPDLEILLQEIRKCQLCLGEMKGEIKKAGENAMASSIFLEEPSVNIMVPSLDSPFANQ